MKTQTAFTLIELMATLAVAAILVTVALPNLRYMLVSNRITSKTNELVRVINYAKSESIIRPSNIIRIEAWQEPDTEIDVNNEWGAGWQIGTDSNNDGLDDDEIVKVFEFDDQIIVNETFANQDSIIFRRGRVNRASCNGKCIFVICNEGHPRGKIITLRQTGRTKTETCSMNNNDNEEPPCNCFN